ncbi:hypothetical protein DICPUDRAFT_97368 [Dictyostelium purpureum]|uniref:F-box domain-containing protein n=1 Tax=Dictyostelium purpureum TaxID=5786 RepID=F0ZG53_DICPU|nr:uncharacterized protein DICPUDRAFT_97368 [Dictyostelium purpureum]EGC37040.1 hypothetical protein DICPUDRAFT_97368 [Dictyostelium purpureum]|eukprot:XP_003286397.1 hypothetical protein DICPUDRAFT_97368 [Dictyostelium purpureum]
MEILINNNNNNSTINNINNVNNNNKNINQYSNNSDNKIMNENDIFNNNNNELITKIPREVWIHILGYLNEKDLLNVSFVDSFLYQISQDNFLWKPLYLKKWNVITLPHKKRISIDKNLNSNNKRINTNKPANNNPTTTDENNNNFSLNELSEYYKNINNSNILDNNNNNNNMYNLFDNNFNNSYLNFNFNNVDNSINHNLNNFVQKIFKPKLNIYNINNNDNQESFMNHLPIWKSLYRERKLIVKEGGIEEFYHLLETLIAYPLEFNRKAMMTMYTIVFQLCIVNYRMMNYLLPPMDLYRMLVECCHNHLMKIFNESILYEDGPQLIRFYLHHWNNYIHSIKRINIVFSYFHRDWISKQGEDILARPLSFNLKGANCWWNKMLHGGNTPNDPLAFVHLTTMMARGWFTVFFSQLQFDESDLDDLPNDPSLQPPPQPQSQSQLPPQPQPQPQPQSQPQPEQSQQHAQPQPQQKFNRLFNALDKCRDKNDYHLISNLFKVNGYSYMNFII